MTVEELTKLGLTDDLANKVLAAIETEYVKSGNYIPKAKFDQVLAEKNQLKAQVDQASADLTKLKKDAGDNESLRQTIEQLQRQHKDLEAQHQTELLTLRKKNAILADLGPIAHNPSDIIGFVDLTKVSVDANGAIVGGWEDQKAQLLANKPYMFKAASGNPNPQRGPIGSPTPNNPTPPANNQGQPGGVSIAEFAKQVAKENTSSRFGADTYFGGGSK